MEEHIKEYEVTIISDEDIAESTRGDYAIEGLGVVLYMYMYIRPARKGSDNRISICNYDTVYSSSGKYIRK